jgi:hypothetical protein
MLLCFCFLLAGVLFYLLPVFFNIPKALGNALQNIAFGLSFPAMFSLIWDRTIAPALADELITKIGLKRSVEESGIESVSLDTDQDWERLISVAQHIEVCFDLDGYWWLAHRSALQKASERNCKIRVIVFDASESSRKKIAESLMQFQKNLRDEATSQMEFYLQIKADVRRSVSFPLNSVVCIDDLMFLRVNRLSLHDPKFLCLGAHSQRELGKAMRKDLDEIWGKSRTP